MGNPSDTNEEMFSMILGHADDGSVIALDHSQLREHIMLLGGGGSGKGSLMLNMMEQSIAAGGGTMFMSSSVDPFILAELRAIANHHGRTDDLMVLDFSDPDDFPRGARRETSDTMNPFDGMPECDIVQVLSNVLQLDEPDLGDISTVWRGRTRTLVEVVVGINAWMRSTGERTLSFGTLHTLCALNELVRIQDRTDVPDALKSRLEAYLLSLPGFQPGQGEEQSRQTREQHGFLQMQITGLVWSMVEHYGHITEAPSRVDIGDVVENRRILLVIAPSSASDRIVTRLMLTLLEIALNRRMFNSPQTSVGRATRMQEPAPFLVILDQEGNQMRDGMGKRLPGMMGKARALGLSVILAAQDVDAIRHGEPALLDYILANTNTRIIMGAFVSNTSAFLDGAVRYRRLESARAKTDTTLRGTLARLFGRCERLSASASPEDTAHTPEECLRNLGPGNFMLVRGDTFTHGASEERSVYSV